MDDIIIDIYDVQFNLAQYDTMNILNTDMTIQKLDSLQTYFDTQYLHHLKK